MGRKYYVAFVLVSLISVARVAASAQELVECPVCPHDQVPYVKVVVTSGATQLSCQPGARCVYPEF